MKIAHLIPPQWERKLGQGSYRMTYVPWVLQNPEYVKDLRAMAPFVILDHGLFENDLSLPDPTTIALSAATLDPSEVVLPDILGDPAETVEVALKVFHLLPLEAGYMFVPQARTMSNWKKGLERFLFVVHRCRLDFPGLITIGLSSLRRATGLRAQIGTRILMMEYLQDRGFKMHLLGLCSVKHFFEEELPAALQFEVRGVDTCAAFALGARGLKLDKDSPRLFLGDLGKYHSLPPDKADLIRENIQTLDDWVKGDL